MEELIQGRQSLQAVSGDRSFVSVSSEPMEGILSETIAPVISEGDAIGSVILLGREGKNKMGETEQKLAAAAAAFLGRQMEQ